ncbi:MAG: helix-turn-helix transcriptional regulator [Thermoanaerobaculia bacterium]
MSSRPLSPPPPTDSRGEVDGIAIRWLFDSSTVRITRWDCVVGRSGTTPERHQLWNVIGFAHRGAYRVHSRGGASLIDSTRTALFNPYGAYQTSHPCGFGDRGSSLVVRTDVLLDAIAPYDPSVRQRPEAPFLSPSARCSARTYLLQKMLVRELERARAVDPLEIEETALELVGRVARASFGPARRDRPPTRFQKEVVERARDVLAGSFRQAHRLDDIARAAGSSPFYLCRSFKQETGRPLRSYVTSLRLRASLERVPNPSADLTDVALDLGFPSHSYFTECFRREFGITPTTLRRTATAKRLRELTLRASFR